MPAFPECRSLCPVRAFLEYKDIVGIIVRERNVGKRDQVWVDLKFRPLSLVIL